MKLRKNSQFKNQVRYISSLALAAVSLLAAGEAKAASFTFRPIADTRNLSNLFSPIPSTQYTSIDNGLGTYGGGIIGLNATTGVYNQSSDPLYQAGKGVVVKDGRVAFVGEKTVNGQTYQVISLGSPGTPIPGVPNPPGTSPQFLITTQAGSPFASFGQGIALRSIPNSNHKEVAFVAKMRGTNETKIFTLSSAPESVPKEVASSSQYGQFAPGLSINKDGTVAFTAKGSNGITNVYKATQTSTGFETPQSLTGCTPTVIPNDICPTVKFEAPSINDNGKVSFTSQNGVFVYDPVQDFSYPVLSNSPTSVLGSYREASINNNDLVSAFTAIRHGSTAHAIASGWAQGQVLFTSDGNGQGGVTAGNYYDANDSYIADDPTTNSKFETFGSLGTSSINDKGQVAFMGSREYDLARFGKYGIFVGQSAVDDKVIAIGDSLLDSTVTALSMDRGGLNKDGEITFWARLANGQEGVFMAISDVVGGSQFKPWLPNCPIQAANLMSFCGVTTGYWFDPPTTYGFDYEMDSDSLFTSILDLPSTFENPFTVSVGDKTLGQFGSGDAINFSDYADILGDLLIDGGVKKFTVRTGDAIDPSNPMALPIKLAFNTETANFSMYALEPVNKEKVPEPGTILGLLSVGSFLCYSGRRRQQKKD